MEPEISIALGNTASKHIHFSFLVTGERKTSCVHRSVLPTCSVLYASAHSKGTGRTGLTWRCPSHHKASRDLPNSSQAWKAWHSRVLKPEP